MKVVHIAAFILVTIGALNWGLVGLFDFNLVNMIFGSMGGVENLVYILVGVSAVYMVYEHPKTCTACKGKKE